jgi:dynein heavy chain
LALFFGAAHTKVLDLSDRMFRELKRLYYVTPTNYIELVKGYCELLKQKQLTIGNEIKKLSAGLLKLQVEAEKSEELKQQLSMSSVVLSKKSKDCEDLMVKIESESRECKEKEKEVEIRSAQVEKE